MKKNERLSDLIGKCDDKFIETSAAETTPVAKRRISFMPFAAAAACVCLVGGGIYIYSRQNDIKGGNREAAPNSEGDVLESQSVSSDSESGGIENTDDLTYPIEVPDIYEIPKWDEMEIYQQFPSITHNGVEYTAAGKSEGLTQDDIGEFLGSSFSQNTDVYTDITYEQEFEYYKINSIDSDYAVAVYFPELPGYHVYTNCLYETPTLGDLVSGLNLEEHMQFNVLYLDTDDGMTASHCAVDLSNNDTSIIWDFLSGCYSAESVGDYIEFSDSVFRENSDILDSHLDFGVYSDVLGFGNLSFSFTKGGYITTNITSTGRAFYIGIDKVNELVNLLSEQGIELGENSMLVITVPPVDDTNEGTGESEASVYMTLPYNPPTENTKVYLIAEFAELMGKTPVALTQDEAASILQKISALSLSKISDVNSIDFPTGGGYLINVEGDREQSFNIIGEDILCINGENYCSIESDATELIDEIVGLLGAQDAESDDSQNVTIDRYLLDEDFEVRFAELELEKADDITDDVLCNARTALVRLYTDETKADHNEYEFIEGNIVRINDEYYRDLSGKADILRQDIIDAINHNNE